MPAQELSPHHGKSPCSVERWYRAKKKLAQTEEINVGPPTSPSTGSYFPVDFCAASPVSPSCTIPPSASHPITQTPWLKSFSYPVKTGWPKSQVNFGIGRDRPNQILSRRKWFRWFPILAGTINFSMLLQFTSSTDRRERDSIVLLTSILFPSDFCSSTCSNTCLGWAAGRAR